MKKMVVSLGILTFAFILFVMMMDRNGSSPVRLSGQPIDRPGAINGTIIDNFGEDTTKGDQNG